eukprot:4494992-Amphidinium_carterae.3
MKNGDKVEYFRESTNKDQSGWRGPAEVVDVSRIEHGRIAVRTSTDRVIICRTQDVRHQLVYVASEVPEELQDSQAAERILVNYVQNMAENTTVALGWLKPKASWVMTSATMRDPQLWSAVQCWAARRYHVHVTACRLGAGVKTLPSKKEFAGSITQWWLRHQPAITYVFETADSMLQLDARAQVIQLLLTEDEQDLHAQMPPPSMEARDEPTAPSATAGAGSPLATIPEGSQEGSTLPGNDDEDEESAVSLASLYNIPETAIADIQLALQPCRGMGEPSEEPCSQVEVTDMTAFAASSGWPFTPAATQEILEGQATWSPPELEFHNELLRLLPWDTHGQRRVVLDMSEGISCYAIRSADATPTQVYAVGEGIHTTEKRESIERSDDALTTSEMAERERFHGQEGNA